MALPPSRAVPDRLLLGPGPSNVHPRVLEALSRPLVGHLDPFFSVLMEDLKGMLRQVFGTTNEVTFPVSGTGSAGMEACLANLLEPGDEAVVVVNGVFGARMTEVARRLGAEVVPLEVEWGQVPSPDDVRAALDRAPRPKLFALVHAETSTGAGSGVAAIAPVVRESGALFVLDVVTSLAGARVEVDAWGVDAAYAGTQKCLSCPPGLAPVTFSPRAVEAVRARTRPVSSWYLDLLLVEQYWGAARTYHHTAPISMSYALTEALRLVLEEGLERRVARHRENHLALAAGLEALGFEMLVAPPHRLPMLTSVLLPETLRPDEAALRRMLLERFGIEVGGGLGPLAGRIWRIGLMGESSRRGHVLALLGALEELLIEAGALVAPGNGVAAAQTAYTLADTA